MYSLCLQVSFEETAMVRKVAEKDSSDLSGCLLTVSFLFPSVEVLQGISLRERWSRRPGGIGAAKLRPS